MVINSGEPSPRGSPAESLFMRLSTALSAMAGGLVLGWGAMAAADPPPPAAPPPSVPIFYCPAPTAAPAATTAARNGAGCPTGRTVTTAVHHPVRHHQWVVQIAERQPAERWEEHRDPTGHLFMYRYNDAMQDVEPSCPHRGHPCPPEPRWGHLDGPGPDGPYAQGPQPPAPPMPHCHHGCPPAADDGVYAEGLPAPAPPMQNAMPPCVRHHDCPRPPRYDGGYAQTMPPLAPPAPRYEDRFAQMTPPPAPPPPREGWWRSHHGMDDRYAEMAPPPAPPIPAPPPRPVAPPVRVAPPAAYAYEEHGAAAGYAYQRRETEHSSGWSYSEADGHGHYQHWDDHDGARPPPPRPPCPQTHGCPGPGQYPPAAYANGAGQWADGSYGQVYEMTGRDAHGYLVWPGKNPQPN